MAVGTGARIETAGQKSANRMRAIDFVTGDARTIGVPTNEREFSGMRK